MAPKIVNGVLLNNEKKRKKATGSRPWRAGAGEFVAGGGIHLTGVNARQSQNRSYVPFQGAGNRLTTAEKVVNALVSSCADPK